LFSVNWFNSVGAYYNFILWNTNIYKITSLNWNDYKFIIKSEDSEFHRGRRIQGRHFYPHEPSAKVRKVAQTSTFPKYGISRFLSSDFIDSTTTHWQNCSSQILNHSWMENWDSRRLWHRANWRSDRLSIFPLNFEHWCPTVANYGQMSDLEIAMNMCIADNLSNWSYKYGSSDRDRFPDLMFQTSRYILNEQYPIYFDSDLHALVGQVFNLILV